MMIRMNISIVVCSLSRIGSTGSDIRRVKYSVYLLTLILCCDCLFFSFNGVVYDASCRAIIV